MINVIAVDDEWLELANLVKRIAEAVPDAQIVKFDRVQAALEYVQQHEVDVAFLDIDLGSIDGIELAGKIKELRPRCNIVFCTGYSGHMQEAFALAASDYLLKPITAERIRHAMQQLRNPLAFRMPMDRLFFRCFGEFEVYWQGMPLIGLKKKSKELLAFLIDKQGAVCTPAEISESLWEARSDSNFRKCSKELMDTLESVGQSHIVLKSWGKMGILSDKVACDYYGYLNKEPWALDFYKGSYMSQYKWAAATAEQLAGRATAAPAEPDEEE